MNTASLNLTVEQGGHVSGPQFSSLISLEEAPHLQKGKYTSKSIIWGLYLCFFFAYLGGIHWGLIWITFRPCGCIYLALMPFPSIFSKKNI